MQSTSPLGHSEPARAERHLNTAQFSDANGTLRRIREKPEVRAFRPSVDIRHEPTKEPAVADGAASRTRLVPWLAAVKLDHVGGPVGATVVLCAKSSTILLGSYRLRHELTNSLLLAIRIM